MPKPTIPTPLPWAQPILQGKDLQGDQNAQDFLLQAGMQQAAADQKARQDAADARIKALVGEYQKLAGAAASLQGTRARELGSAARQEAGQTFKGQETEAEATNRARLEEMKQSEITRRTNLGERGRTYRSNLYAERRASSGGGGSGDRYVRGREVPDNIQSYVRKAQSAALNAYNSDASLDAAIRDQLEAARIGPDGAVDADSQMLLAGATIAGIVPQVADRPEFKGMLFYQIAAALTNDIDDDVIRELAVNGLEMGRSGMRSRPSAPPITPEEADRSLAGTPQMSTSVGRVSVRDPIAAATVYRGDIYGGLDPALAGIESRMAQILSELDEQHGIRGEPADILRMGQQTAREQLGGRKAEPLTEKRIQQMPPQQQKAARSARAALLGRTMVQQYTDRMGSSAKEWAKIKSDPIYQQAAEMMRHTKPGKDIKAVRDQLLQRYSGNKMKQEKALASFMMLAAIKQFQLGEID